MNADFLRVIAASPEDRRGLFLATANRLGTPMQNVEKDFWVSWVLDLLFNGRDTGEPRLLFKGGTSLSKAYGLISRFSEDIDITVFREDIGQDISVSTGVDEYVKPTVKIEAGAKSALDPHRSTTIQPYVADDMPATNLVVQGVVTIDAERTFWDKVVILRPYAWQLPTHSARIGQWPTTPCAALVAYPEWRDRKRIIVV